MSTKRLGIRLYHGTAWLSRVIQSQTWSTINHAAVEHLEDDLVSEALAQGIVLRSQADADAKHSADTVIHAFDYDVPSAHYDRSLSFAQAHQGDRYDWWSLPAFSGAARKLFRRTDPTRRKSSGVWICSEWAEVHARMCEIAFLRGHKNPAQVSPADLWDSLRCDLAVRRRLYALNQWQVLA